MGSLVEDERVEGEFYGKVIGVCARWVRKSLAFVSNYHNNQNKIYMVSGLGCTLNYQLRICVRSFIVAGIKPAKDWSVQIVWNYLCK